MLDERVVQRLLEARNLIDDILMENLDNQDGPPSLVELANQNTPKLRNTSPPTADVTIHLFPNLTLDSLRKSALTDWERRKSILFAIPDPLHEGYSYLVGPVPAGCELEEFQDWWKRAVESQRMHHGNPH